VVDAMEIFRLAIPSILLALSSILLSVLFPVSSEQDEQDVLFPVHLMLAAALPHQESINITTACVPDSAQDVWRREMHDAVETMLQKTLRTMQRGLAALASAFMTLVSGCTCGETPVLLAMKEQASRLKVFATAKGVLNAQSKISYEPLKALQVAGVDVHLPLNRLLVAWKMNKGPDEVGQSLRSFLEQFGGEEAEAEPNVHPAHKSVAPADDPHGRQTPSFWKVALNSALAVLGDPSKPVTDMCLTSVAAMDFSTGMENSFEVMLEKHRRSMMIGLKQLSRITVALLNSMLSLCGALATSLATKRLQSAAERLTVFSTAKTLANFGVHIEYEALKSLKVGGIDVHQELNMFIGAWRLNQEPQQLGESLAKFFQDFSEDDTSTTTKTLPPPKEHLMFVVLRDAMLAADKNKYLTRKAPTNCFSVEAAAVFSGGLDAAVDEMLKKRRKTMQTGLRRLADATDQLMQSMLHQCTSTGGAKVIWQAAKKLQKLTRRAVVDYGTHIKYEATKSLYVGGIGIHSELNSFIVAWRLGNQPEAGKPFGLLMRKCSEIVDHDEF